MRWHHWLKIYAGIGVAYAIAEYALASNPNFAADTTDQTLTGAVKNVFGWPYFLIEYKGL